MTPISRKISYLICSAFLLHSPNVIAGGSETHGGNAVVCFSDPEIANTLTIPGSFVSKIVPTAYFKKIVSVKTLDLVKAENLIGESNTPKIAALHDGESFWDYGLRLAHSFDLLTVSKHTNYSKYSRFIEEGKKAFGKNISFDPAVFPQNDIQPLSPAGEGCVYTTVAVQRSIGEHRRELAIDGRYFEKLSEAQFSELSKAVLIMHEFYLSEVNEFATTPVLNTEGVQELVARSIRTDSTLRDLFEIINRRNLFPGIYFNQVHLETISDLLYQFRAQETALLEEALKEIQASFFDVVRPVYNQFPKWYRNQYPLDNALALWGGHYLECAVINDRNRCLSNEEDKVYQDFIRLIMEFSETTLFDAVQKKLDSKKVERIKAFEETIKDLAGNPLIDPECVSELNVGARPWIESGRIRLPYKDNKVSILGESGVPSDPTPVTVQILSKSVRAN